MASLTFTLEIAGLEPDRLRPLEFDLVETVSKCFTLRIRAVASDDSIVYDDVVGKDATLTVAGEDFPITHFGVVTEYHQYPDAAGSHGHNSVIYDLLIEPHLKLLEYSSQNRIFQKMGADEIVKKVLTASGMQSDRFRLELNATYPKREFTVQYNETDLNFVQRLLEDEGIWYFFDHTGDSDVMVMCDATTTTEIPETPTVEFLGDTGLAGHASDHVTRMRRSHRMITGKTKVKDYNDRKPAVNVLGTNENAGGTGEHTYFAPNAMETDEAKRVAKLRGDMLACEKVRLDGEGVCRAFRAGHRFELQDEGGFAGKYMLTRVEHHGDQREGFEGVGEVAIIYTNRFSCMPADTQFRPALIAPKPRINGVITAKVNGPEGNYAYLDEEGRYHAKLPFDLGPETDGGASLPIRMAQPYGGPDYGMHFPVHNGNDLVLAFFDGDVDRPIALGTTPNPDNASPVTSRNKTESVIKTASGHTLRMDDDAGHTIVDLTTAGKHLLAMDDDSASQSVKIKTTGGHLFTMDDTGKNVTILTTGGHTIKIDDGAKSITVETKGGHSMVMDDPGKTITLKDGQGVNTVTLDGGGKALSLTSTGDIKISADKNIIMTAKEAINITATKDISAHADGAVSITADKTMVQEAKKDYTLKAKKIGITAEDDYIVAAKKMDFKAEKDFKVAAGKVNVKSDADVILKGSKVAQN